MKKLLAFTIGLSMAATVVAQDDGGSSPKMWLGGEVTFGAMSARDFTLGPGFGIMLNDNMAVGGSLMFSSENNSSAWNIEPYSRYYIPVVDKFAFYGDAFVGIGGGDNDTSADGGEYNSLDFGAGVDFSAVNFSFFFHF